jgi:Uma2 family endonuclease
MFDDNAFIINPLAVLKPPKEPHLYTLAQYLRKEERAAELHEYYDGYIIKLSDANAPHNTITVNVGTALHRSSKERNEEFMTLMGKQLVYLPNQNFALYPDVVLLNSPPQYFDYDETLIINPILIVEVLSKGIKKLERTSRFHEYKTLATFKEHILIDKNKCSVQISHREEPNAWRITEYTDINGSIYLKSIDCTISLADIYENITLK